MALQRLFTSITRVNAPCLRRALPQRLRLPPRLAAKSVCKLVNHSQELMVQGAAPDDTAGAGQGTTEASPSLPHHRPSLCVFVSGTRWK